MSRPAPPHACEQMRKFLDDERLPIGYSPHVREYWLPLIAGHDAVQLIAFCPWCGAELPRSLRKEYFDKIEPLGFDITTERADLPQEFQDDTWWRSETIHVHDPMTSSNKPSLTEPRPAGAQHAPRDPWAPRS